MSADDWIAPSGTVKRFCTPCGNYFASRGMRICPTCKARGKARTSPFEPSAGKSHQGNGYRLGVLHGDAKRSI